MSEHTTDHDADLACTCWRGPNHGTACPLYVIPPASGDAR